MDTARKMQRTDVSRRSFILVFGSLKKVGDAGHGGEVVVVVN